ncbi:MAG: nucleotidyltransferase family protein [Candidatus Omnitrophota bacterium]
MNKTVEKIKRVLKNHKKNFCARYGIKEVGLFGSFARGEQKKNSDIDILVEFKPHARISLLGFIELENRLSDLLRAKVDLVEKSALKPRIGRHILREVIYL